MRWGAAAMSPDKSIVLEALCRPQRLVSKLGTMLSQEQQMTKCNHVLYIPHASPSGKPPPCGPHFDHNRIHTRHLHTYFPYAYPSQRMHRSDSYRTTTNSPPNSSSRVFRLLLIGRVSNSLRFGCDGQGGRHGWGWR